MFDVVFPSIGDNFYWSISRSQHNVSIFTLIFPSFECCRSCAMHFPVGSKCNYSKWIETYAAELHSTRKIHQTHYAIQTHTKLGYWTCKMHLYCFHSERSFFSSIRDWSWFAELPPYTFHVAYLCQADVGTNRNAHISIVYLNGLEYMPDSANTTRVKMKWRTEKWMMKKNTVRQQKCTFIVSFAREKRKRMPLLCFIFVHYRTRSYFVEIRMELKGQQNTVKSSLHSRHIYIGSLLCVRKSLFLPACLLLLLMLFLFVLMKSRWALNKVCIIVTDSATEEVTISKILKILDLNMPETLESFHAEARICTENMNGQKII